MPKSKLDIFAEKYLKDFNPEQPFFWRLQLPYARFVDLEQIVALSPQEELMACGVASLCYLAEWYKWRYAPSHGLAERFFNP